MRDDRWRRRIAAVDRQRGESATPSAAGRHSHHHLLLLIRVRVLILHLRPVQGRLFLQPILPLRRHHRPHARKSRDEDGHPLQPHAHRHGGPRARRRLERGHPVLPHAHLAGRLARLLLDGRVLLLLLLERPGIVERRLLRRGG